MVARQQSLQIDHVPSRLNAIRPNKPRLVRHRITSLYSEMNHERTQTANSFTRSCGGGRRARESAAGGGNLSSHFGTSYVAAPPPQPSPASGRGSAVSRYPSGFSPASICARRGSRNGGSASFSPSVSIGSSVAEPGPSGGVSKQVPFGSGKKKLRK